MSGIKSFYPHCIQCDTSVPDIKVKQFIKLLRWPRAHQFEYFAYEHLKGNYYTAFTLVDVAGA